jgi:hypothetical protein
MNYIGRLSAGLLSMIRILGCLPIIRAQAGGAAEMLAKELCSTLKENISPRGVAQSLFTESLVSGRTRPLLLIFDRLSDMSPPLLHTSTYQSLVDDLLDHKLNKVTVEITHGKEVSNQKKKTYDLNTQIDSFYQRYASKPFPEAVEANQKELNEVLAKEADIRSRPQNRLGLEKVNGDTESEVESKDLLLAIESLPELTNKKKNLETHTNILRSVMQNIAAREVPTYFEVIDFHTFSK